MLTSDASPVVFGVNDIAWRNVPSGDGPTGTESTPWTLCGTSIVVNNVVSDCCAAAGRGAASSVSASSSRNPSAERRYGKRRTWERGMWGGLRVLGAGAP